MIMELIFHETQEGSLCAQHCLNSLLQSDYYSAVDLANIAHELDTIEKNYMSEAGTSTIEYERYLNQESSNYDDTGYFSIQVLVKALKLWNLDLIPYTSQNELAKQARQNPVNQKAYICHFKQHWYTIRKIGNYWFNLNSLLKKPELISDTYLSVLLAQLQSDVDGDLPFSQADRNLIENPINVKEVLAQQNRKKSALIKPSNTEEYDDDDLKKAIQASLIENDMDLDSNRFGKLYPSLAVESVASSSGTSSGIHGSDDDDLKRAIALSLLNSEEPKVSNIEDETLNKKISIQSTSNTNITSKTEQTNADEIRKKRLEYLNKK